MRHMLQALVLAGGLAAVAGTAGAADGTAVGVNPAAVAELSGIDRTLIVGADVSVGERIVTGGEGLVQIIFKDDTRLVVGPNSALLIEQFLLRGKEDASDVTINALAGSFRFITGKSAKDAYEIKTPTGTIGVRGTAIDILVFDFASYSMLLEGEFTGCNFTGQCVDAIDQCDIAVLAPDGAGLATAEQRARVIRGYNFSRFQSMLLSDFRVMGAGQCIYGEPATPRLVLFGPTTAFGDPRPGDPDDRTWVDCLADILHISDRTSRE